MYVELVLPWIVVPTFRVRRYRPAAGIGRAVPPWVQLVLPFGATAEASERRSGVRATLTAIGCVLLKLGGRRADGVAVSEPASEGASTLLRWRLVVVAVVLGLGAVIGAGWYGVARSRAPKLCPANSLDYGDRIYNHDPKNDCRFVDQYGEPPPAHLGIPDS